MRAGPRYLRQRGVALVFAAISLVASLAALALAIDIGRLYFERRDLQRVANMAALDVARVASGCVEPVDNPDTAAYDEARASVLRNAGSLNDLNGGSVSLGSRSLGTNGVFMFVPGAATPSAYQIHLVRDLPARLIPGTGNSGSGSVHKLRATAAAASLPMASLFVGSRLAEVDSDLLNQLLGGLLGGPVTLDALSYRGLFNATVSLGSVIASAAAGTAEDFLTTSLSGPEFLRVLSDAASAADSATRSTLETLAGAGDPSREVTPGGVIGVPPGFEEAASGAVINLGAVAEAAAQAANGQNLFELPADLNIPGVLDGGNITARLIQTASPAIGPGGADGAQASNAQGLLQISLPLLPILGNPATLKMFFQVAQATAQVLEIECARSGRPYPVVHVRARASAARLGFGEFDNINSANPVPQPSPLVNLNLLGIPLRITASAMVDVGQDEDRELIFRGPFDQTPQRIGSSATESLGSAMSTLARNLRLEVEPASALLNPLLRPILQPILNQLASTLVPILNQVDDQLLTPALAPLGLTLGGADVTVSGVTGDQPVLFNR